MLHIRLNYKKRTPRITCIKASCSTAQHTLTRTHVLLQIPERDHMILYRFRKAMCKSGLGPVPGRYSPAGCTGSQVTCYWPQGCGNTFGKTARLQLGRTSTGFCEYLHKHSQCSRFCLKLSKPKVEESHIEVESAYGKCWASCEVL